MTKENYIRHMEELTGLIRPSSPDGCSPEAWKQAQRQHKRDTPNCPICKARVKSVRANNAKKAHDELMKDCGLVKGKTALGRIIWE
ncbi:MAG: hypothetical protein NUV49_01215 [Patescibacteria group bacterium]|nr:hypothetical protein [Patescibacteria group bacterium]